MCFLLPSLETQAISWSLLSHGLIVFPVEYEPAEGRGLGAMYSLTEGSGQAGSYCLLPNP